MEVKWEYYKKLLNKEEKFNWDYIVLTASNDNQAKFYEMEIQERIEQKRIPITNYIVIADTNGERIGSGGATLNIINYLHNIEDLKEKKILIIHSGGDSIRIPQYSSTGKIFANLPNILPNEMQSTLFDELMITFSSIPNQMDNGIVCLSGDVLLKLNPKDIVFKKCDSACVSIKANSKIGCNHGVYITNSNNEMIEFLHKINIDSLKEKMLLIQMTLLILIQELFILILKLF